MNLKIALKAYSFQVIEWNLTKFSVAVNGIFSCKKKFSKSVLTSSQKIIKRNKNKYFKVKKSCKEIFWNHSYKNSFSRRK